jgi:hypothetical protein
VDRSVLPVHVHLRATESPDQMRCGSKVDRDVGRGGEGNGKWEWVVHVGEGVGAAWVELAGVDEGGEAGESCGGFGGVGSVGGSKGSAWE